MGFKTPLYDKHLAAGARMIDFGGWDMPVDYGSQKEEHHAVRRHAGMFDVSHMTVIDLSGDRTREFLRHLLANDPAGAALGAGLLEVPVAQRESRLRVRRALRSVLACVGAARASERGIGSRGVRRRGLPVGRGAVDDRHRQYDERHGSEELGRTAAWGRHPGMLHGPRARQ